MSCKYTTYACTFTERSSRRLSVPVFPRKPDRDSEAAEQRKADIRRARTALFRFIPTAVSSTEQEPHTLQFSFASACYSPCHPRVYVQPRCNVSPLHYRSTGAFGSARYEERNQPETFSLKSPWNEKNHQSSTPNIPFALFSTLPWSVLFSQKLLRAGTKNEL